MERRPNDIPNHSKEATGQNDMSILDDTTLLTAVSVLYAILHLMATLNVDPCTC
jgi:hypothetical protein